MKKQSQRGVFQVEFYTNLAEIKQRYENGAVVAKILYEDLRKENKISMTYDRFSTYFKKEIKTPKK